MCETGQDHWYNALRVRKDGRWDCSPWRRRFDSGRSRHAPMAQLVELEVVETFSNMHL